MRSPSNSGKRSERGSASWRHLIKNHLTAVKGLVHLLRIQLSTAHVKDGKNLTATVERLHERLERLIDDFQAES